LEQVRTTYGMLGPLSRAIPAMRGNSMHFQSVITVLGLDPVIEVKMCGHAFRSGQVCDVSLCVANRNLR
jgi:hypothetical protein